MDKEALKAAVCSAIDAAKADIEKLPCALKANRSLALRKPKRQKK